MARNSQPIKCRLFVPDDNGDYRLLEELSPEEQAAFGKQCSDRMGAVFNDYFSQHPEIYAKF